MQSKYVFLMVLFCFSYANSSFSQSIIKEELRSMTTGNNNSFSIAIKGVDKKLVDKEWENFVKEYKGKTKRNKKTGIYFTDNAYIVGLGGANTVDLYASSAIVADSIVLTLWVDLGGSYLNSKDHLDKIIEVQNFLKRFSVKVRRITIEQLISDEEKKYKKLESNLDKLKNENENLRRDIDKAQKVIRDSEGGIIKNDQEAESTKKALDAQSTLILSIKKKLAEIN
ncbi:MAG: hypothetical protein KA010_00575 [Saprospiraceae bacterium]|nr:hypothetical protein [Saprospiraceae bacterium]